MARYAPFGNAIFGETLFGIPPIVTSYTTITIKPMGFDTLQLNWKPPGNTPSNNAWDQQVLVRSSYGTPNNLADGVELFNETPSTGFSVQYVDTGLVSGRFYYYTLFVYNEALGEYFIAAQAQGLVLTDWRFGQQYASWIPEWYIEMDDALATTQQPVGPLVRYLNLLGYEMDWIRSEIESLFTLSNIELVSGTLLPYLGANYGMGYEYELGMIRSRVLVKNAVALYKERGTKNGIQAAASAFSAFGCEVTIGPNLEIQLDDSAFDRSTGHWKSANGYSFIRVVSGSSTGIPLIDTNGDTTIHSQYNPYPNTINTPTNTGVAGYLPQNNQNVAEITAGGVGDGQNWVQFSPNDSPSPRQMAAMAPVLPGTVDSRLVMFGGTNLGQMLGDTWEWQGFFWSNITLPAPSSPPNRWYASMAYDPVRNVVVLYGGQGFNGYLRDTWEWAGEQWVRKIPGHEAVEGSSMTYNGINILRFGGFDGSNYSAILYSLVTGNWKLVKTNRPPDSPTGRAFASMISVGTDTYLFGGENASGYFGDTWHYTQTLTNWVRLTPASSPNPRSGAAFSYDPSAGATLFGGYDGSVWYNDTWTWDGTNWALQSPADSPPAVDRAMFSPDGLGNLILFGGRTADGLTNNETWLWDGFNWSLQSPSTTPPPTIGGSMVYDALSTDPFMFGGAIPSPTLFTLSNINWQWEGVTWVQVNPSPNPIPRMGSAMVWDSFNGLNVLFGGCSLFDPVTPSRSVVLNDVWHYLDGTWYEMSSVSTPPVARYGASMAFDPNTSLSYMHGGFSFPGTYLSDTWSWDAAIEQWTEVATGTAPVYDACFVFDPNTNLMILFGGKTINGDHWIFATNDTWTFNGSAWTYQPTTNTPSPRYGAKMVYDPSLSVSTTPQPGLFMYGGTNGTTEFNESWFLNTSTWAWQHLTSDQNPPAVSDPVLGYDTNKSAFVLFGGLNGSNTENQTWLIVNGPIEVPIELSTCTINTAPTLGIPIDGVPVDLEQATPFEPSTIYVLSAWFQPVPVMAPDSVIPVSFQMQIDWYGKNGDLISSTTGSPFMESEGTWVLAFVVGSPPFGAYTFGRTVLSDPTAPLSGQLHVMDAEQVEINVFSTPSPSDWSPPRDIQVNLLPVRQNLVNNPQFLSGLFYWNSITGALKDSESLLPPFPAWPAGTIAGAFTVMDNLGQFNFYTTVLVNSGIAYTFSMYMEPVYVTLPTALTLTVTFVDSSNTAISVFSKTIDENTDLSTFTRYAITIPNAPANSVSAVLEVSMAGGVEYDNRWVTGFMFEPSDFAGPYFDGTFSPASDYIFEGNPNESVSDYYPQLLTKISRLSEVLVEYVPIGSTFSLIAGSQTWINLGLYTGPMATLPLA